MADKILTIGNSIVTNSVDGKLVTLSDNEYTEAGQLKVLATEQATTKSKNFDMPSDVLYYELAIHILRNNIVGFTAWLNTTNLVLDYSGAPVNEISHIIQAYLTYNGYYVLCLDGTKIADAFDPAVNPLINFACTGGNGETATGSYQLRSKAQYINNKRVITANGSILTASSNPLTITQQYIELGGTNNSLDIDSSVDSIHFSVTPSSSGTLSIGSCSYDIPVGHNYAFNVAYYDTYAIIKSSIDKTVSVTNSFSRRIHVSSYAKFVIG